MAEATKLVLGELPALPHLPELPARGPGRGLIGRGAGFLIGLPVELYTGQWRVAAHPGRDLRRTRDLMDRDLDVLTEAAVGLHRPAQGPGARAVDARGEPGPAGRRSTAARPWRGTGPRRIARRRAARPRGRRCPADPRRHGAAPARRAVGARGPRRADPDRERPANPAQRGGIHCGVRAARALIDAVGVPVVVHCCAAQPPLRLFRDAGRGRRARSTCVLVDSAPRRQDDLGELLDGGSVSSPASCRPPARSATRARPPAAAADAVSSFGGGWASRWSGPRRRSW